MADLVLFDVDGVKSQMASLESDFESFANILKALNDYVETMVNAGADSAIFGEYGTNLLNVWNANASNFGDFHANFEAWNEAVAIISANNSEFAVDTQSLYRDNASSLDGIKEARDFVKENGRTGDFSALGAAAASVLGNASKIATIEPDEDGNLCYRDKDGNLLRKDTIDENGNLIESVIKDENGNDLTVYKVENGVVTKTNYNADGTTTVQTNEDGVVTSVVTDKSGKPISTTVYGSDGKVQSQVINDGGSRTEVSYGENGKQLSVVVTDENGKVTTVNYDENGNPVSATIIDDDGKTINYEVGESGKLEEVIAPEDTSGESPEAGDPQGGEETLGKGETPEGNPDENSESPAGTNPSESVE